MGFTATMLATHNRAGEIVYRHLGTPSPTFEISIITYTDRTSLADRDSLQLRIQYVGGAEIFADSIARDSIFEIYPSLDIRQNYYTLESFTFPGPGRYVISMYDPNRIENICNIANSVNVPFYIEDTLVIRDPQFYAFNSSPVLLESPIVFAKLFEPFSYNPGAYDPDGDSLVYTLIPPRANQGTPVSGYVYPNQLPGQPAGFPRDLTLDADRGDLRWNVPTVCCTYNIAILIREYRDGALMGTQVRDMQIIVSCEQFTEPPQVNVPKDTCVLAGSTIFELVTGSDPDFGDRLTLTASGGPFFVQNNPATFTSSPGTNNVNGVFNWNTNCSHISPQPYTVVFKVEDDYRASNGNLQPFSDIASWRIRVVAPPPEDFTATPQTNGVQLSWDANYICAAVDTFLGFSIWRKRGCDSVTLDPCFTGSLTALGYTKIAGPVKGGNYLDNTVTKGVVYSYRIVPEFAKPIPGSSIFTFNPFSGAPSPEACTVVNADVPLITNVDVLTTDVATGEIQVKWVRPDAAVLDTVQNPPPYVVELYRHQGFVPTGAGTLVYTTTYNSYGSFLPSTFVDQGLNTVDGPYSYTITFSSAPPGAPKQEIGESAAASSIFLTTQTGGSQIALSWDEQVPWVNYEYYVLRELPGNPGVFDTVGKTPAPFFVDTGLVNGETYCYKIRSYGSYFNPLAPSPLINHSQKKCDIPQDTIPPCQPQLTIANNCEDIGQGGGNFPQLVNTLTWTNPVTQCNEDALVAYRIYYAPSSSAPLTLLTEVANIFDTIYNHRDLNTLAGCYVVTAVDSFGNESSLQAKTCIDNCPFYELPSAFSPNGDGDNDVYTPFLPFYFVERVDMKIFNRWGNQVFATEDPMINWDGTDQQSGSPLKEGVYYYTCEVYELRVDGITKRPTPLSGYIHLMRGN